MNVEATDRLWWRGTAFFKTQAAPGILKHLTKIGDSKMSMELQLGFEKTLLTSDWKKEISLSATLRIMKVTLHQVILQVEKSTKQCNQNQWRKRMRNKGHMEN